MGSMPFHYRQQRSCGKVMFLHVCHPVQGGVWQADTPGQTPPRQTPTPGRQTPPPVGRPPPPAGRHPPWEGRPPRQTPPPSRQADPQAPGTATAADGTPPTGMYSCCNYICIKKKENAIVIAQCERTLTTAEN